MITFRTMGGRKFTIDGNKFPRLIEVMRKDMLTPSKTNKEYMERIAKLLWDIHHEAVPTLDEQEFIEALQALGIVERIEKGGKQCVS